MFDLIRSKVIVSKIPTRESACKKWFQKYNSLVTNQKVDYETYSAYYDAIDSKELQIVGVRVVDRTRYIYLDHHNNRGEESIFECAVEAYKFWYDAYIAENDYYLEQIEKKLTDFDSYRDFYVWFEHDVGLEGMGIISEVEP